MLMFSVHDAQQSSRAEFMLRSILSDHLLELWLCLSLMWSVAQGSSLVVKLLGYWSEGYGFNSQGLQAIAAGPLSKAPKPQLYKLRKGHLL